MAKKGGGKGSDGSGKKASLKAWKSGRGGGGKSNSDRAKSIAAKFPKKADDPF